MNMQNIRLLLALALTLSCGISVVASEAELKQQVAENQERDCSICLESIVVENKPIVLTSCIHEFHRDCLYKASTKWDLSCPVCREEFDESVAIKENGNKFIDLLGEQEVQHQLRQEPTLTNKLTLLHTAWKLALKKRKIKLEQEIIEENISLREQLREQQEQLRQLQSGTGLLDPLVASAALMNQPSKKRVKLTA